MAYNNTILYRETRVGSILTCDIQTMDCKSKMNDSDLPNCSSRSVVRNLRFASFESTPTTSKVHSRKRKSHSMESRVGRDLHFSTFRDDASPPSSIDSSFSDSYLSMNDTKHSETSLPASHHPVQSPCYEISFINNPFIRSSPFNKTSEFVRLSSSLEQCSLYDLECLEETHSAKRSRWDNEELTTPRKSNSAPGTPQRSEIEVDVCVKKYHSLEFTPTKGYHVKIGTPERNQILYPQLLEVKPETKPKSPQKLRADLKRICKPARKRLFAKYDFVHLFTKVKDQRDVISKIFSYLPDSDLVRVAQVSKLWNSSLKDDVTALRRYKTYVKAVSISKENLYDTPLSDSKQLSFFSTKKTNCESPKVFSPPTSPSRENWRKFAKMATRIDSSQRLTKCILCSHPAVIDKHIAQCSRSVCLYIWCTKCFAGSKTGPEDFLCLCTDARSPQSPLGERCSLTDISNVDTASTSSFFIADNSASLGNINSSSGYFSQSDHERSSVMQNNSFSNVSKSKHTVLTDCNKNYTTPRYGKPIVTSSSASFHNVALQCRKQNSSSRSRKESDPSTSPPKTDTLIGLQSLEELSFLTGLQFRLLFVSLIILLLKIFDMILVLCLDPCTHFNFDKQLRRKDANPIIIAEDWVKKKETTKPFR
ncbi:hypothetical protein CBL_13003 [Carabus blaptoides fortunei]